METLCKLNGNFRSNRLRRKKWSGVPPKVIRLFGKFPFDPRVPFALQPVEPEILVKSAPGQCLYCVCVKGMALRFGACAPPELILLIIASLHCIQMKFLVLLNGM